MSDKPVPKGFFGELGSQLPALTNEQKAELEKFEGEGMKEELKGLPVSYPRIEILHQGTAQFKFTEEDKILPTFDGVIVHIEAQRVWWPTKYGQGGDEEDKKPHCYSRDLVKPDPESQNPQNTTCGSCPQNQWKSDVNQDGTQGRGKSCKEVRRVFIVPEGRLSPHWIAVPPSNLKPLAKYLQMLRNKKVTRPQLVVTKFSLKTVKNRDGIEYSELALGQGERIPESTLYAVLELKRKVEETLQSAAPLAKDDYEGETSK